MKQSSSSSSSSSRPGKPGLLGQLADFFDDRTGYRAFVHEALYERVPGGARWRYVWGSTLVFAFMTQVITGLVLWASYSASAQTAWESVYYIQHEMAGGWLLRGIHHVMAQMMVVLLALHLMQVVIDGAYRAPREVNFWLGLILMMLVLGMALTGYLLPWDQKGYWATRVATNLAGLVPLIGPSLQQVVVGGPDYGHHTLTRFFALHAGFLPATLVALLVVHLTLFRKHGLCARQPLTRPDAMFWPDQVLKDAVAMLAVMAVVLGVILLPALRAVLEGRPIVPGELGAELGAPADPSQPYAAARPEWYFLFLFQFLKVFEGWGASGEFLGAIVVPGLVMGMMFLMPIVGRWDLGHRFNIGFTVALLAGVGLLTALAMREDYCATWIDAAALADVGELIEKTGGDEAQIAATLGNDPEKIRAFATRKKSWDAARHSRAFMDASEQAEVDAARAVALAGRPERIPPTGALELVRGDALSQGPKLFAANCASCHGHIDPQQADAQALLAKTSAANLHGFGAARSDRPGHLEAGGYRGGDRGPGCRGGSNAWGNNCGPRSCSGGTGASALGQQRALRELPHISGQRHGRRQRPRSDRLGLAGVAGGDHHRSDARALLWRHQRPDAELRQGRAGEPADAARAADRLNRRLAAERVVSPGSRGPLERSSGTSMAGFDSFPSNPCESD